jgi:hypothetical protein
MSAGDLAAVVVVIVSVAATTVLVLAAWWLVRLAAGLREAALELAELTREAAAELDALTVEARAELGRADALLTRADGISATLEGASRLTYLAVSNPVIKAAAVANGVRRGARRLRGEDTDKGDEPDVTIDPRKGASNR